MTTPIPSKHFNVNIRAIPHQQHRYDTVGDWFTNTATGTLDIKTSQLSSWRLEALISIHELIEAVLCRQAGVTERQVDKFDMEFSGDGEPGDDPSAPYHQQHKLATAIEKILAKQLGVNWEEYEKELNSL